LNCQVAFTDLFNDEGRLEKDLGKRIYDKLLKEEIKTDANNVYSAQHPSGCYHSMHQDVISD
jgi:hypothetical protein